MLPAVELLLGVRCVAPLCVWGATALLPRHAYFHNYEGNYCIFMNMNRKKLIESLPLLTVLLVIISHTYLHTFFKQIGIDYYQFADATEILLGFIPLFAKQVILAIMITFLISTVVFWKIPIQKEIRRRFAPDDNIYENIIMVLLTIGLVVAIWWMIRSHTILYPYIYIVITVAILTIFRNTLEELYKQRFTIAIVFYGGTCVIAYMAGKEHGLEKLKGNSPTHILFKKETNIVTSNDTLIYFGETKNFIFMYNKADSTTLIYNKVDLDSIVFKKTAFLVNKPTPPPLSIKDSIINPNDTAQY